MKVQGSDFVIVCLAALVAVTLRAQQPAVARTTNDRIFTEEQAKRGGSLYEQQCAACHGLGLAGIEMTPPLAGPEFIANWSSATVSDLFERIRVSMPQDKPGTLSRQQIADVVAFVLSANMFPAGQTELSREADALKIIRIVPVK